MLPVDLSATASDVASTLSVLWQVRAAMEHTQQQGAATYSFLRAHKSVCAHLDGAGLCEERQKPLRHDG